MVESHVFLLHGELDTVLVDVCLLQDSLEPTEGSSAVQLVGLLVVDENLSRDMLDLLYLCEDARETSAKARS